MDNQLNRSEADFDFYSESEQSKKERQYSQSFEV